jgi:hypothetical protein
MEPLQEHLRGNLPQKFTLSLGEKDPVDCFSMNETLGDRIKPGPLVPRNSDLRMAHHSALRRFRRQ